MFLILRVGILKIQEKKSDYGDPLNNNMDDQKAAKILIKRSKKNPILYSPAEILYAKRIKKLQKVND
jgi:hypothetical protein